MFHACDAMLTPKDVLYLEDLLDQTFVLNKRITNDVTMIQNEEVKPALRRSIRILLNIIIQW